MPRNDPRRVPFNRPSFAGDEQRYIAQAIANHHISGDGLFTKACSAALESMLDAPRVLLTTNCTHALEMTALLLHIGPGDEVIMPSFTFVSTANAFVLRGASPVFVDVREDTFNINERLIEAAITPRTKAIVVVHYAGVGCEMNAIAEIAARHGIPIVEDNAHGLLGRYRNRPLGSFGSMSTQSFHETKNLTCGEGGALALNDDHLIEKAEIIREKGTNRARFFRGQVDKYTWVGAGSSYLPSDILAAFLLAQIEARDTIQATRQRLWVTYRNALASWGEAEGVRLPIVPDECEQAYHMFYLLLPSLAVRNDFIDYLGARDVCAVFHYVPLHLSPLARQMKFSAHCPVTELISDRIVRLPFYNSLEPDDQQRVIEVVTSFRAGVIA